MSQLLRLPLSAARSPHAKFRHVVPGALIAIAAAGGLAPSALAAGAPIVSVPSSPAYDSTGKYKLSANVNANGSVTAANIQYGATTSYGSTFTHETVSAAETRSFTRVTAAMPVGSTVNYRVLATNASGTTYGPNQTYTVADKPAVSVEAAPSYDSAGKYKLTVKVVSNGAVTAGNIQYGTTTSYGKTFTHETISAGQTTTFSRITDSYPVGTTVNYRVLGTNSAGTTYGPNQTFVVGGAPVVTTAGRPTAWAATANPLYRYAGNVKANGLPTTTKIQYGHTTSYGSEQTAAAVAAGDTSKVFASLSHSVHYVLNYRTVATNAAGTTYGPNQTFKVPGRVVRPVYLHPSDVPFRQDYNDLIQDAHEQAQEFYADELAGKTFTLAHRPVVCQMPEDGAFYGTEVSQYVGSWQKLRQALSDCLGSQENATDVYATYADIPYTTCSPWNRIGAAQYNVTLMGRNDLRGLSGETGMSNAPCPGTDYRDGPWGYTGGLAHELGHTFGLPHPPNMEGDTKTCEAPYTPGDCAYTAASLLWQGYTNINTTYLLPANKTALATSPYFS